MEVNFGDSDFNRLLDAFKIKESDRVPVLEFWPQSQEIIEYVIGRPLEYKIESAARSETTSVKVKDAIEFAKKIGMDAIGVDFIWCPGMVFEYSENGNEHYVDGCIKTMDDLRLLEQPENIDYLLGRLRKYIKTADGTGVGIYPRLTAFFNPVYLAMGIYDFSYKLYDDPGFIDYLLDLFLEHQLIVMKEVCKQKEVRFIQIDDDIAFGSGLFVSREKFLDMFFERMKVLLKPAKEKNILIAYHTDGKLDEILPILIELGIQAIRPAEPYSNDIYEIKSRFGDKICLCGNIELNMLINGTLSEIREDVKEHLKYLKPGGGYVCGSSSSLFEGIPPKNYIELVKTVHKYGRY